MSNKSKYLYNKRKVRTRFRLKNTCTKNIRLSVFRSNSNIYAQIIDDEKQTTLLASSPETKYQIFKYQNHAYGIQFHIEVKETTVNEWGCVPEYKSALEKALGPNALKKFDNEAQTNMEKMNNYSKILYSKFKSDILKI